MFDCILLKYDCYTRQYRFLNSAECDKVISNYFSNLSIGDCWPYSVLKLYSLIIESIFYNVIDKDELKKYRTYSNIICNQFHLYLEYHILFQSMKLEKIVPLQILRCSASIVINDLITYIQDNYISQKSTDKKLTYKLRYQKFPCESFYINNEILELTPALKSFLIDLVEEKNQINSKSIRQRVSDLNKIASDILGDKIKLITKQDSSSPYRINTKIDTIDAYDALSDCEF